MYAMHWRCATNALCNLQPIDVSEIVRMFRARPVVATLAITAAWIAGCSTPDRVVRVYEDTDYVGGTFSKVLVVGAHENAEIRRRFEDSLVWHLNRAGTDAVMSIETMGAGEPLNRWSSHYMKKIAELDNKDVDEPDIEEK